MSEISDLLKAWKVKLRAEGVINGIAAAGTTTDFDFILPNDRYFSSLQVIANGHVFGDHISVQIVHPLAGVVKQFGYSWYLEPDNQAQTPVTSPGIPAKLTAGIILRIKYTSIGPNPVSILVNSWMHEKDL